MNHDIALYKKSLKKNLPCTAGTRKRLLQQFQVSADAYLEENPAASMADLCSSFGPPDEMAKVLMEAVSQAEAQKYQKQTRLIKIISIVLLVMIFIQVIYSSFFKDYTITTDSTVTEGTIYTIP